ncbi:MAG TPA: AAA family ATPase, partial [Labilithrix sp.]|nr:AAA family ATPase [Labilithrix sp.]
MRIAQLQLLAFGPFRGLELDLSAPGLHMIFGRNEAGKSTTLRAITGLLYGIDTRTQDAHLHKPSELRVGGTLTGDDGARLRIVRRKGVSKGGPNTLLDEKGQALDEAALQRLLRGVSEETFRHAFGLDHDTLAEGAKALLEGRGDIAGSLFDASVGGGGDVRALLAELQDEADALYKARGSTLPLNVALKAFADLQKSVKEKERLPAAFVVQQKALDEGRARHKELVTRRAELARRRAQIDSARRRIPLERRRAQGLATLAELGEVARHAPRIASLQGRLAGYELAKVAHHDDTVGADRLRVSVAEAARRAGVPAAAKDLRLDVRTQARIAKHVQERGNLGERLDTARVELARNERDLARLRSEGTAPELADAVAVAALGRALGGARKLGDATSQLATMTSRSTRKRAELEARVSALGVFDGTLEQLVALRPPPVAVLDALAERAAELDRVSARLAERAAELEAQVATIEQQLAEAGGDFAPPTAADLRAAREARDRAWQDVQSARDGEPALRATHDASFVRATQVADVLADRMLVEADRVTTLARYRAQLSTFAVQRSALDAERAQRSSERKALDEEHLRLWIDAGVAPAGRRALGLAEMREWLVKRTPLVEGFAVVCEGEADARDLASLVESARRELAAALGEDAADASSLSSLLDRATARLDRIERERHAALAAAGAIVKLEAEIAERRSALLRDEATLGEAQAKLAQLVSPLGIPGDADGGEVMQSLE